MPYESLVHRLKQYTESHGFIVPIQPLATVMAKLSDPNPALINGAVTVEVVKGAYFDSVRLEIIAESLTFHTFLTSLLHANTQQLFYAQLFSSERTEAAKLIKAINAEYFGILLTPEELNDIINLDATKQQVVDRLIPIFHRRLCLAWLSPGPEEAEITYRACLREVLYSLGINFQSDRAFLSNNISDRLLTYLAQWHIQHKENDSYFDLLLILILKEMARPTPPLTIEIDLLRYYQEHPEHWQQLNQKATTPDTPAYYLCCKLAVRIVGSSMPPIAVPEEHSAGVASSTSQSEVNQKGKIPTILADLLSQRLAILSPAILTVTLQQLLFDAYQNPETVSALWRPLEIKLREWYTKIYPSRVPDSVPTLIQLSKDYLSVPRYDPNVLPAYLVTVMHYYVSFWEARYHEPLLTIIGKAKAAITAGCSDSHESPPAFFEINGTPMVLLSDDTKHTGMLHVMVEKDNSDRFLETSVEITSSSQMQNLARQLPAVAKIIQSNFFQKISGGSQAISRQEIADELFKQKLLFLFTAEPPSVFPYYQTVLYKLLHFLQALQKAQVGQHVTLSSWSSIYRHAAQVLNQVTFLLLRSAITQIDEPDEIFPQKALAAFAKSVQSAEMDDLLAEIMMQAYTHIAGIRPAKVLMELDTQTSPSLPNYTFLHVTSKTVTHLRANNKAVSRQYYIWNADHKGLFTCPCSDLQLSHVKVPPKSPEKFSPHHSAAVYSLTDKDDPEMYAQYYHAYNKSALAQGGYLWFIEATGLTSAAYVDAELQREPLSSDFRYMTALAVLSVLSFAPNLRAFDPLLAIRVQALYQNALQIYTEYLQKTNHTRHIAGSILVRPLNISFFEVFGGALSTLRSMQQTSEIKIQSDTRTFRQRAINLLLKLFLENTLSDTANDLLKNLMAFLGPRTVNNGALSRYGHLFAILDMLPTIQCLPVDIARIIAFQFSLYLCSDIHPLTAVIKSLERGYENLSSSCLLTAPAVSTGRVSAWQKIKGLFGGEVDPLAEKLLAAVGRLQRPVASANDFIECTVMNEAYDPNSDCNETLFFPQK